MLVRNRDPARQFLFSPKCLLTWGLILTVFKPVEEAVVPFFMTGTALAMEGTVMQIRICCLWV